VTHLRQLMLDELQRRNYSPGTTRCYIHAVEDLSKYFHRSPERLGPSHIRKYQVHLFRDRELSPGTIQSRCAALRFLFVKTLRRPYLLDEIPFPKRPRKLPTVLSPEEVARLIDSAQKMIHRAMLMTLYATGLRRAELCHLKVTDILIRSETTRHGERLNPIRLSLVWYYILLTMPWRPIAELERKEVIEILSKHLYASLVSWV